MYEEFSNILPDFFIDFFGEESEEDLSDVVIDAAYDDMALEDYWGYDFYEEGFHVEEFQAADQIGNDFGNEYYYDEEIPDFTKEEIEIFTGDNAGDPEGSEPEEVLSHLARNSTRELGERCAQFLFLVGDRVSGFGEL